MSRYGWSLGREQSSPYGSMGGGIPAVTDDDYSYITSQDLADPPFRGTTPDDAPPPEDDVLLIKNKGVTYPAHFPAYAIGDGKLRVQDVRDRVGLMMDLPDRATRRIKLLYKGRQLKEPAAPVRDYGVKNNSEVMAVLADLRDESSVSDEEMVIVNDTQAGRRKKKKSKKKAGRGKGDDGSASSPRDSLSNPEGTSPSSAAGAGAGAAAMKRLDELFAEFRTNLQPLCNEYIASPPPDAKKRLEEHRKLSETVMQNVILKIDEVDAEGVAKVRERRKEVVQRVQEALRALDAAKAS
ncbi:uncharacterized protein UV8b_00836 [Ustilaginoidea virens]|uniref:BAG domain-containing protein n=1 Tax=Ustilaginoidea virens TaxID=1159556 RepID=A0A1B5L4V3_USTVR|nr:uncharacterized protein UV8b_00836 [Ustilaginoidea virens]QUC16595.1 hypothetical protein UV8b_00836 [Ustilaginoidea virens]GAO18556.1 hypothetical protein UVI_02012300 [Ustilaginoidea virens]